MAAALTQHEAEERSALLRVVAYDIDLVLTAEGSTFEVTTVIDMECRQPGATTFLQLEADQVVAAALNGEPLDPTASVDGRVTLSDLRPQNRFECRAVMSFSDGRPGLMRRVDPADGSVYIYADCEVDGAPRVFACFDQPDLKAPVTMHVTAPPGWTVLGNGPAQKVSEGRWELETTPPLATYFVTVCAGPFASRLAVHDGIAMGLHARASLAGELERWAPELFDLTGRLLDHFHHRFAIRYPFGEYHQVFAPEYVSGAMENPGCVVLRDDFLYQGAPSVSDLVYRAVVIAHEMAHMWFGDLVTLRWWDDLWLNESFAEYAGCEALDHVMPGQPWPHFALQYKQKGYAAERRPTAHPVAGAVVGDTDRAMANFDSITYGKGTSALRQLALYLGEDRFDAGLREYLTRFSFGNATLGAFMEALEHAAGRDLSAWQHAWLLQPGRDRLAVDIASDDGTTIREARLRRIPPDQRVDDGRPPGPHHAEVAGWSDGVEAWRTTAVLTTDDAALPGLVGRSRPTVVVPNARDLTWAVVVLDPGTLESLPGQLSRVPDQSTRAALWVSLIDTVRDASLDPHLLLNLAETDWVNEPSPALLDGVGGWLLRLLPMFLPEDEHPAMRVRIADAAWRLLEGRPAVGQAAVDRSISAVRAIAQTTGDEERLLAWMRRENVPAALRDDLTVHWLVVQNLAEHGVLTRQQIDEAEAADGSTQGRLAATKARASIPTAEAKRQAWEQFVDDASTMSVRERVELVAGLWRTTDLDLVRPYVEKFFSAVPELGRRFESEGLIQLLLIGFPLVVEAATVQGARQLLATADLDPVTRNVVENLAFDLSLAVAARARFASDTPVRSPS